MGTGQVECTFGRYTVALNFWSRKSLWTVQNLDPVGRVGTETSMQISNRGIEAGKHR